MSTRRRVTAAVDGRAVVFQGWRVADLLKEAGTKPIYAGSAGGWMIDLHRLGDVLAYLEQRNVAVAVTEKGTHILRTPGGHQSDAPRDVSSGHLAEDGGLW